MPRVTRADSPRLPDWPLRWSAFVRDRRDLPMAWGANDCTLFAADAVLALQGVDPAQHVRGTYSTARAGLRVLQQLGGPAALATQVLGPALPGRQARIGDVVLVSLGQRHQALTVCNGAELLGPGPAGLSFLPLRAALICWRV